MAVPTKAKAKVATDWSKTVAATPEGGIVMGNPKAKVTLVEYGSLTCSHCKHFAEIGV
ncbi:MAG: thioredoxin domain-containing protein, partial [Sphingomicrobium sp.]